MENELDIVDGSIRLDGEYDFILYQDFLDDPQVLIKKLQKK